MEAELFTHDFDSVLATQFVKRILEFLEVGLANPLNNVQDLFFTPLPFHLQHEYIASA